MFFRNFPDDSNAKSESRMADLGNLFQPHKDPQASALAKVDVWTSRSLGMRGRVDCCDTGRTSVSPGASHCTCRGLNRVFQKSDGSCICQAGHESYDKNGLESEDSSGGGDCQPQVPTAL